MPVSGHPIPRPQRQRPDTMGCAVEASPKRLRHHLRRPDADEGQLIMKPPLTPLIGQTPIAGAWFSTPIRRGEELVAAGLLILGAGYVDLDELDRWIRIGWERRSG